tara:strand:+ start:1142 stop:1885 length:744 start_codon:yes stop_codon:yes gene_type:complete
MINFCLKSFGKVKLIISRLSKLTTHVECILNKDNIVFVYDNIRIRIDLKIIDGVLDEKGEGFRLNICNLHNILKNIPAISSLKCKWNKKEELTLITQTRKSFGRAKRENSTKIMVEPLTNDFNLDNLHKNIVENNGIETSLNHLIWVMEKMEPCFEKIKLVFCEEKLCIKGSIEEYHSYSEIKYDENCVFKEKFEKMKLDIYSDKFLYMLWLLELVSCKVRFYIDPKTLKMHALSKSENEQVLLMFR